MSRVIRDRLSATTQRNFDANNDKLAEMRNSY